MAWQVRQNFLNIPHTSSIFAELITCNYRHILQNFDNLFPSWMLWRCYRSSSRTLPTVCRQFRENTARCWQTDRPWTVNSTRIDRWDEANAVQRRGENIKEFFLGPRWLFIAQKHMTFLRSLDSICNVIRVLM